MYLKCTIAKIIRVPIEPSHSWLSLTPRSLAASSGVACKTLSIILLSLIPNKFEIRSFSLLSATSPLSLSTLMFSIRPVRLLSCSYRLKVTRLLGAASAVATGVTVGSEILSRILDVRLPSKIVDMDSCWWLLGAMTDRLEATSLLSAKAFFMLAFSMCLVLCFFLCRSMLCFRVNFRPHTSHVNGRSPVCVLMWRLKSSADQNGRRQKAHFT